MKYYKDSNNEIFADPLKLEGLVEITKEEVDAILAPTPEEAQAQTQELINNEALEYLSSTDWYVVRLTETGVAIPAEVLTLRAEARLTVVPLS